MSLENYNFLKEELRQGKMPEEGTVIRYEWRPRGQNKTYLFAAIFMAGYWYTTAQDQNRVTHRKMMEFLKGSEVPNVDFVDTYLPLN